MLLNIKMTMDKVESPVKLVNNNSLLYRHRLVNFDQQE